jgi:hypothetical protein
MRSLERVASEGRGVAMDRFLSPLGGSELSWPSPSEEAWVVSGASVRAIDVYGNGCSSEGGKRGTLRRRKAGSVEDERGYWNERGVVKGWSVVGTRFIETSW